MKGYTAFAINIPRWKRGKTYVGGDVVLNPSTRVPVLCVAPSVNSSDLGQELAQGLWVNLLGGSAPVVPISDNFPSAIMGSVVEPEDATYWVAHAPFKFRSTKVIVWVLGVSCTVQMQLVQTNGSVVNLGGPLNCVNGYNELVLPFSSSPVVSNRLLQFAVTGVNGVERLVAGVAINHYLVP